MTTTTVEKYIQFCNDANISHREAADSIRKYILAYQRNLQHKGAFTVLFGEGAFINWDHIERLTVKPDCAHWLQLFKFFDFSRVVQIASNFKVLNTTEKHLVSLGIDRSFICLVILIKNMNHITGHIGLERLFCEYEVKNPREASLSFLALQADEPYDVTDTTATFIYIMQNCQILEEKLNQQIAYVTSRSDEAIAQFKNKTARPVGARPRLRDKRDEVMRRKESSDSVHGLYRFKDWSRQIGFSGAVSLLMPMRLYFVMAQSHLADHAGCVERIVNDQHIHGALKRVGVISTPDSDVIFAVISSLKMIEEPFRELHLFRSECMGGFSSTQLSQLKLNDLLHLYVCAYQNPSIWKDVWRQIVPLSNRMIHDVETFVGRHAFNFDAVVQIMMSGATQ